VGGGIVWDSDADEEVEESLIKARPLLALLGSSV
jgi:anthranilate/para-aminobenzoate synthase component I